MKYGIVNKKKIWPKADLFIIKADISNSELEEKDYYLCERDLRNIKYDLVPFSGISVKRRDSKQYQILKMGVSTFGKLFSNTELGAGASIYCKNKDHLYKNDYVLKGWNSNWKKFDSFFSSLVNQNIRLDSNIETFQKIKKISNKMIQLQIMKNRELSDFLFKGIGNFEEPFTATYLFENSILKTNYEIPFSITTGSGRSKGVFTLVLKPA